MPILLLAAALGAGAVLLIEKLGLLQVSASSGAPASGEIPVNWFVLWNESATWDAPIKWQFMGSGGAGHDAALALAKDWTAKQFGAAHFWDVGWVVAVQGDRVVYTSDVIFFASPNAFSMSGPVAIADRQLPLRRPPQAVMLGGRWR